MTPPSDWQDPIWDCSANPADWTHYFEAPWSWLDLPHDERERLATEALRKALAWHEEKRNE